MDPLCKYVTYTAIDKDDILASVSRRHLLIIMCVIIHECWNHETSGWGPGVIENNRWKFWYSVHT